jgi:tetratricopeptide (TPR) repeat protein
MRDCDRTVRPLSSGFVAFWLLCSIGSALARCAVPCEDRAVYDRAIHVPQGAAPAVVVCEFLTHRALQDDGANLWVTDARQHRVAWRVLQVGPGDFCRVAFQPANRETAYHIHYGGDAPGEKSPEWANGPGLILETRAWKGCDLNREDSLDKAFETATPLASAFVPNVFHHYNPLSTASEPFLSRYQGMLLVPTSGRYSFYTSSQDASFLRIDGKTVVAFPGRHGPEGHAKHRGEVTLKAGPHTFTYLHAAAGSDTCMAAYWQPPGAAKIEPIPPEAFGSIHVAHISPGPPTIQGKEHLRDFVYAALGEVVLEEPSATLVRVQFRQATGAASSSKVQWQFGDGQTSTLPNPVHIYLEPGLYTVKLSSGETDSRAVENRVPIDRPAVPPEGNAKGDALAEYLPILESYDPAGLEGSRALAWFRLLAFDERDKHLASAGQAWLEARGAEASEPVVLEVARLVGPVVRDRLEDPGAALEIWTRAGSLVKSAEARVACATEVAELSLWNLLKTEQVATALEEVAVLVDRLPDRALAARVVRLQGDLAMRRGDEAAARAAYARAVEIGQPKGKAAEREARRGAFDRSVEAFLRDREWDQARDALRHWEEEFPLDRIDGSLTLLEARYRAGTGQLTLAIALTADLLAVNPDSPFADRVALLAAECEERLGHTDRAVAALENLLHDYPGSPLVPDARAHLAKLQSAAAARAKPGGAPLP